MIDAVFNSLLVGSSSYALAVVEPMEHPFIFTACAVSLCHGLLGFYSNIKEGLSNSQLAANDSTTQSHDSWVQQIHSLTQSCVDIISVPLINIDLYQMSQQSSPLALGHGLFIVPLIFDLSFKLLDVERDASGTETLKELTTLGNIVSLVFLSANENHLPYGLMAMAAFFAQYGSMFMESSYKGSGANAALLGYSMFFAMIPTALSNANSA